MIIFLAICTLFFRDFFSNSKTNILQGDEPTKSLRLSLFLRRFSHYTSCFLFADRRCHSGSIAMTSDPGRSTSRWGSSAVGGGARGVDTVRADLLSLCADTPTLNKQWAERREMSRDPAEHRGSVESGEAVQQQPRTRISFLDTCWKQHVNEEIIIIFICI